MGQQVGVISPLAGMLVGIRPDGFVFGDELDKSVVYKPRVRIEILIGGVLLIAGIVKL